MSALRTKKNLGSSLILACGRRRPKNHAPVRLFPFGKKKTPSPAGAPGSKSYSHAGDQKIGHIPKRKACAMRRGFVKALFQGKMRGFCHFEPKHWFKMAQNKA
jgi:hypothetical protein